MGAVDCPDPSVKPSIFIHPNTKLAAQELLAQTSHYADKVRKDALTGMADLFTSHPDEARRHTGVLFEALVERITDGDQAVRKELKNLLQDKLLPIVTPLMLGPFVPLIMAHVCSAMTHCTTAIRMDALGYLEVLMQHAPQLVTAQFLAPSLLHFCDLLSQMHRGRSIKAQSMASLLKVTIYSSSS